MLSRNRILLFFFSFLSLLGIFGLYFALFHLFCCLWICFLDCTHFVTVTCWAVNLLLHYFHPILHLIYTLVCSPVLPDSSVQQTWLCTWQRPWEGHGLPLQRVAFHHLGHILALLCALIFNRKRKGNKKTLHKTPTPNPLPPSAWELLAYFLEYMKSLVLNFLLDETLKGLYKIRAGIIVSNRCLSFS